MLDIRAHNYYHRMQSEILSVIFIDIEDSGDGDSADPDVAV